MVGPLSVAWMRAKIADLVLTGLHWADATELMWANGMFTTLPKWSKIMDRVSNVNISFVCSSQIPLSSVFVCMIPFFGLVTRQYQHLKKLE